MKNNNEKIVPRGLYAKLNISIQTLNTIIISGIVALILCIIFAMANRGFVINFDTNGGSHIQSYRAMYGEYVNIQNTPVKEGFVFDGWYTDKACTIPFDIKNDKIVESITLYANWKEK